MAVHQTHSIAKSESAGWPGGHCLRVPKEQEGRFHEEGDPRSVPEPTLRKYTSCRFAARTRGVRATQLNFCPNYIRATGKTMSISPGMVDHYCKAAGTARPTGKTSSYDVGRAVPADYGRRLELRADHVIGRFS